MTGRELCTNDDDENGMLVVGMVDRSGAILEFERNERFTDEQVLTVYECAQDLRSKGILTS